MAERSDMPASAGRVPEAVEGGARRVLARLPRLVLRLPILAYRYSFSAFMGRQCRYLPTCSEFAEQAIERHGAWAGGWMAGGRMCRCHPWGGSGFEAVPEGLPPDARWYAPWRYARRPGGRELGESAIRSD